MAALLHDEVGLFDAERSVADPLPLRGLSRLHIGGKVDSKHLAKVRLRWTFPRDAKNCS